MRMISAIALAMALPQAAFAAPAPAAVVTATAETIPVGTANDDAADDPAIWRNAADPAASLIVATDKKAGLYVYGLDGQARDFVAAGRLNNVDLIDLGRAGIIVAASDRNNDKAALIQLYRLDTATAKLTSIGAVPGGAGEAYGICLYRDRTALYAFSVLKDGDVHQVRLTLTGASASGAIVRTLRRFTQTEGCVVDAKSRSLFVGEENVGIWRFAASETASLDGTLAAAVDGRMLVADVEGLTIAEGRGKRYLVASSQGDNAYVVYALPAMKPVGRFKIGEGKFGAVEETDGIALDARSFGANYPEGLFIAQDGVNPPAAQNFKLVSWRDVLRAIRKR